MGRVSGRASSPIVRDAFSQRRRAALQRQSALASGPPIAALVFDAYGTLFDVGSVTEACGAFASDAEAFASHWRRKQLEYSWLRSLMGQYADFAAITAEALDQTLADFGATPAARARQAALDAWQRLTPFPDVKPALTLLARWRLAILSNGTPAMLDAVVRHAGLADRFTAILSVDAAQVYKPDPRAYALAPAALALDAGEILFVTANAWDAVGAKSSGLRVAWCNRAGQSLDRHGPEPDMIVQHLEEIAEALAPQSRRQ